MSFNWIKPAYETRLGNSTAKCILALIADQANADGYGYPSLDFITYNTEVSMRTVRRVMQVFIELDLLAKVDRGRRHCPGLQLNTALLGADLKAEYWRHLRAAEGRRLSEYELRDDLFADVSETAHSVSETGNSDVSKTAAEVSRTGKVVSETTPPHPLYCVPLNDPDRPNPHFPQQAIRRAERYKQRLATERACDAVTQACGFTDCRLRRTLCKVIQLESDMGEASGTIAVAMISAWQEYTSQGERLQFRWCARRFFAEGYWKNRNSWPWDVSVLREDAQRAQARLGTF